MRLSLVAAVLIVGCSKPTPPAEVDAAPVAKAAVSVVSVPDAAPVVTTKRYDAAFAHFVKNTLFECIDASIELDIPPDAGADWKPKDDPMAALKKSMKEATKIQQPCGQAFADRTVLASCTYELRKDGGNANVTMSSSFYDFADIGLSDEQMSDCLKGEGKWNALSRTSPEWNHAKLDYDQRKLRGLADKLNQGAQ